MTAPTFRGTISIIVAHDHGDELYLPVIQRLLEEHVALNHNDPKLRPAQVIEIGLRKPSIAYEILDLEANLRSDFSVQRALSTIYHFGNVSHRFEVPFQGSWEELKAVSRKLVDGMKAFQDAAARRSKELFSGFRIVGGIRGPLFSSRFEDYIIYDVSCDEPNPYDWLVQNRRQVTELLVPDAQDPSDQVVDSLVNGTSTIRMSDRDVTLVAWDAALLINVGEHRAVPFVEWANSRLLSTMVLLDAVSGETDRAFAKREVGGSGVGFRTLAELHGERHYLFADLKITMNAIRSRYLALLQDRLVTVLEIKEEEERIRESLEVVEDQSRHLFESTMLMRAEVVAVVGLFIAIVQVLQVATPEEWKENTLVLTVATLGAWILYRFIARRRRTR